MSATGLDVFDKTIHTTNVWLDGINQMIGPDRAVAWKVLSVVLHCLRDQLPLQLAAHLGAQLPLMVRGVYYDQFEPEKLPGELHSEEDFLEAVHRGLQGIRPVDSREASNAVFETLSAHISGGQVRKVRGALPKGIRKLWPEAQE